MKLCKDCKHLVIDYMQDYRCGKSPMPPDYVHGTISEFPKFRFYQAQTERQTVKGCGAEGRFWEAK